MAKGTPEWPELVNKPSAERVQERLERQRLARREQGRVTRLLEEVAAWRRVQEVDEYVAALRAARAWGRGARSDRRLVRLGRGLVAPH